MKYDYMVGSLVKMPPDEAATHGDKVQLRDMKNSLYRVMVSFNKPKKVKVVARKNTNKE